MMLSDTLDASLLLTSIYGTALDYAILTFDLQGKVSSWNAGAERITGFQAKEMMGEDNGILFTPDDRARQEPRQEMLIDRARGRAWLTERVGTAAG
ncbi:PAS domain-containing protein [Noviherbaspirillum aridicola]|uniref:PAS domain-containing protein n=1 Tax=Noviherbaspirillum aridicola TaxID=2849687 RepID=A0ABQ4Q0Y8_9BURK|nr:PAS domain-containing protein [Noviherbaspirillum aridicola]GIZ50455.1 hypothetical protein NCCP691_04690 [Noviherbaspirillum aridicola]